MGSEEREQRRRIEQATDAAAACSVRPEPITPLSVLIRKKQAVAPLTFESRKKKEREKRRGKLSLPFL